MTAVITRATETGTTYWYEDTGTWISDPDLATWYAYPVAEVMAQVRWPGDIDIAVEAHMNYTPMGHYDA